MFDSIIFTTATASLSNCASAAFSYGGSALRAFGVELRPRLRGGHLCEERRHDRKAITSASATPAATPPNIHTMNVSSAV
jgi:hypothetical protein